MRAFRLQTIVITSLALCSFSCNPLRAPVNAPLAKAPSLGEEILRIESFFSERRSGLRPPEIERVAEAIVAASRRAGFSPALVLAVIEVESSGRNSAVSEAGALGLMQLRPATGEAVAARIGERWKGPATLFDPVANVRLGVRYLEEMVQRFGSLPTALAAYNWGPTCIAERLRRGEPIPVVYAHRVMTGYRESYART
jgi:soluble lytic murein transglycosylase-like protein